MIRTKSKQQSLAIAFDLADSLGHFQVDKLILSIHLIIQQEP